MRIAMLISPTLIRWRLTLHLPATPARIRRFPNQHTWCGWWGSRWWERGFGDAGKLRAGEWEASRNTVQFSCRTGTPAVPDKSVATVARRWKNAAILHALASVATVNSTFVGRVTPAVDERVFRACLNRHAQQSDAQECPSYRQQRLNRGTGLLSKHLWCGQGNTTRLRITAPPTSSTV